MHILIDALHLTLQFRSGHTQYARAEGRKLDESIGRSNAHRIVFAYLRSQLFNKSICRLVFFSVCDAYPVVIEAFACIALHSVTVENEDDRILLISTVICKDIHKTFSRKRNIAVRKASEALPAEDDIIAIDYEEVGKLGLL